MGHDDQNANAVGEDPVLVAEDAYGALVVGSEASVAEFLARWADDGVSTFPAVPVEGADRTAVLSVAADLGSAGATAARYVRLQREVPRGGTGVVRLWVKGPGGRIVSNKPISAMRVAGPNPAVALGMIAVRMAIAESTATIVEAVERVEDKTNEILRLAGAQRTGDVHGHHRVLRRRVAALDAGAEFGETDWSAVAALGPTLEVGVERLRDYANRLVADLRGGVRADQRADRLDRVVREGRLDEVMRLLVIAEQSLYLWQRLRIEQVRLREPQLLEQAVADAHAVLAEHLRADGELVTALRKVLENYGVLRALEFHRKVSGRRLRSHLTALREDLDAFVTARGLQVESWGPLVAPTARDAVRAARVAAVESGRAVRAFGGRAVDGGLAGVSRAGGAVQAKADQWRGDRTPGTDGPAGVEACDDDSNGVERS
jgi:hypothetical protein